MTTCDNREAEASSFRLVELSATDLQLGEIQLGQPLGHGAQQRRAGTEIKRGGAVRYAGFAVDFQMAQTLGPVVGQQLNRRIA